MRSILKTIFGNKYIQIIWLTNAVCVGSGLLYPEILFDKPIVFSHNNGTSQVRLPTLYLFVMAMQIAITWWASMKIQNDIEKRDKLLKSFDDTETGTAVS